MANAKNVDQFPRSDIHRRLHDGDRRQNGGLALGIVEHGGPGGSSRRAPGPDQANLDRRSAWLNVSIPYFARFVPPQICGRRCDRWRPLPRWVCHAVGFGRIRLQDEGRSGGNTHSGVVRFTRLPGQGARRKLRHKQNQLPRLPGFLLTFIQEETTSSLSTARIAALLVLCVLGIGGMTIYERHAIPGTTWHFPGPGL